VIEPGKRPVMEERLLTRAAFGISKERRSIVLTTKDRFSSGPLEPFFEICQILFDLRRRQAVNVDMEGRNIFLKMHFEREQY
jgi:hypothetical protein